jgi:hypothetical protein
MNGRAYRNGVADYCLEKGYNPKPEYSWIEIVSYLSGYLAGQSAMNRRKLV